MKSPILTQCIETYRAVNEKEPLVEIAHGGLECGIISDRCGGLDSISMGPTMKDLHSPDERLYVPSLVKVWNFLEGVLKI